MVNEPTAMRTLLLLLLPAMCLLCGVQWWRESQLRELSLTQRQELVAIQAKSEQLNERVKAADAEILRLTADLNDLRATSVPKTDLEAAVATGEKLKAQLQTASEALTRQNAAIEKANQIIQKTATERDELARKANELAEKYNGLVKKSAGQK